MRLGVLLRYKFAGLGTAVLSDLLISHCCSPLGLWSDSIIATVRQSTAAAAKERRWPCGRRGEKPTWMLYEEGLLGLSFRVRQDGSHVGFHRPIFWTVVGFSFNWSFKPPYLSVLRKNAPPCGAFFFWAPLETNRSDCTPGSAFHKA
jgi:hypothetical protein